MPLTAANAKFLCITITGFVSLACCAHVARQKRAPLSVVRAEGPGSGRVDVLALHCESLPASCSPKEAQAGGRLAGFLVSASSVAV